MVATKWFTIKEYGDAYRVYNLDSQYIGELYLVANSYEFWPNGKTSGFTLEMLQDLETAMDHLNPPWDKVVE